MNNIKTLWAAIVGSALALLPAVGAAQAVQQGTVVEMNSGGRPIAGVAVAVVGAAPTDTDSEGRFRLLFPQAKPGAKVVAGRIYKSGYEIVNDTEIKSWVLSETTPFKIVMCPAGQLDESRRKFYDIGRDRYYTLYNEARGRLSKLKEANRLDERQYADSLETVLALYEDNMRRLDYYADKFSRINRDELNEMDARALELMEQGLVDEAIAVYEDAQILRVFRDKTAQADTLSSNIAVLTGALVNQARLLVSAGGAASYSKADSILLIMGEHNPDDPAVTAAIAEVRVSMGQYAEAYEVLAGALPKCRDMEAGERLAAALTRAAEHLDSESPGGDWLVRANAIIGAWRRDRELRTLD